MMITPNKQRGIGLLELMLSIAIIAVMILLVAQYYTSVSSSRKVNEAVGMVQAVMNACESWKLRTGQSLKDVNMQKLVDQGLVPTDFATNLTVNPWGGAMLVKGEDDNRVEIILEDVPPEPCTSLKDFMTKKGLQDVLCEASGEFKGVYQFQTSP